MGSYTWPVEECVCWGDSGPRNFMAQGKVRWREGPAGGSRAVVGPHSGVRAFGVRPRSLAVVAK